MIIFYFRTEQTNEIKSEAQMCELIQKQTFAQAAILNNQIKCLIYNQKILQAIQENLICCPPPNLVYSHGFNNMLNNFNVFQYPYQQLLRNPIIQYF